MDFDTCSGVWRLDFAGSPHDFTNTFSNMKRLCNDDDVFAPLMPVPRVQGGMTRLSLAGKEFHGKWAPMLCHISSDGNSFD